MTHTRILGARRGLALATAVAVLLPLASTQVSVAKTTKKAAKKAAATTKKKVATTKKKVATTARPTATTVAPDEGVAKTVTGMEVAPGAPVKIGITWSSGNEAITGNIAEAYEIAFNILRKNGELPVHGRDVVVINRNYAFNSPDVAAAARGACTSLVQDDKVFAALTWAGPADCLAENKVPAIGGQVTEETMQRIWPYGFSFQWNSNQDLANVPAFADSLGLLKGHKLGMYHGTAAGRQKQIDDHFKPQLKKLGYSLTEEATTGATNLASDAASDRVAVQRFKAAGVDTIFMTAPQPGDFGRAAQAQGYKPKYIFGAPENAIICDGCPARVTMSGPLFDGSYALVWRRIGENGLLGNPQPSAAGVSCAENFEKFSGERTRQNGTPAEASKWSSVQWACDGARAVVTALKAAGPKLTQGAFINALETSIKGQQSGLHFDYTFTRTSHFGTGLIKTLQLEGDCLCWRTRSAPRKPFV